MESNGGDAVFPIPRIPVALRLADHDPAHLGPDADFEDPIAARAVQPAGMAHTLVARYRVHLTHGCVRLRVDEMFTDVVDRLHRAVVGIHNHGVPLLVHPIQEHRGSRPAGYGTAPD